MTAPSIVVSGDITADVAAHMAQLLGGDGEAAVNVELGDVASSAGLISTGEVVSMASALAAILSFLSTTWTVWRDRRHLEAVGALSPEDRVRALDEQLRAFRAEGYEVERIQIDQDLARPGKGTATIVVRDVPGRQLIVVDAAGDDRVQVSRRSRTARE